MVAKFIRGLEGDMRLRVNNKPIPDYAQGFRNPVPPPVPGGGGLLTKALKVVGKLGTIPFYVLLDFFGSAKPVSDGTLPNWIKDISEQQKITRTTYPLTRDTSYRFVYRASNLSGGVVTWGNEYTRINADRFNGIQSWRLKVVHKGQVIYPAENKFFTYVLLSNGQYDSAPVDDRIASYYIQVTSQGVVTEISIGSGSGLWGIRFVAVDGVLPPPVIEETTTSDNNQFAAGQALIETLGSKEWQFSGFTRLPTIKPGKNTKIPDFFKLPEISPKPIVIPTEIPQPIPEPDLDPIPEPEPKAPPVPFPVPKPVPKPIPNPEPKPNINPDPQPDVNPKPDPKPDPKPRWKRITYYTNKNQFPEPPVIIDPTPPIIIKNPTPLPEPKPIKTPPPIQTPIDPCADHCGGGTIDFNLPDDSDLGIDLAEILKKLDEIEQSVNQTLGGTIEVGSCKIQDNPNNDTDELAYKPDPEQAITYNDKGLKAVNLAIQGVQTKLTSLHKELCRSREVVPSTIPEWWQVRAGSDRPQLVVIFKGGGSYWSMALPWYKGKFQDKMIELIPEYKRGNFSTILTLNDNSKIVVNAFSKIEGENFMKRITKVIKPKLLEGAELKSGGERKGKPLKTGEVIPVYAKYFATGQQNLLPDWRYNFKTKKFIKYVPAE